MKIKLNETPSKCSHIILEVAGRKIVTTKQDLMGAELMDMKDLKTSLIVNELRQTIRKSGTTNWTAIKKAVELTEFKT